LEPEVKVGGDDLDPTEVTPRLPEDGCNRDSGIGRVGSAYDQNFDKEEEDEDGTACRDVVTQKDGATDSSQPKSDVEPTSPAQEASHSYQLENRSPVPDGLERSGTGEGTLSRKTIEEKTSFGINAGHGSQLENGYPVPDDLDSSGIRECSLPPGSGKPNSTGEPISPAQEASHRSQLEKRSPVPDGLERPGSGEFSLPPDSETETEVRSTTEADTTPGNGNGEVPKTGKTSTTPVRRSLCSTSAGHVVRWSRRDELGSTGSAASEVLGDRTPGGTVSPSSKVQNFEPFLSSPGVGTTSAQRLTLKMPPVADRELQPRTLTRPAAAASWSPGAQTFCNTRAGSESPTKLWQSPEYPPRRRLINTEFLTPRPSPRPRKPPMFVRKLKNVSVAEGQTARLDVRVDGNPAPSVAWLKNGVELAVDSSKRAVEAGTAEGMWSLLIFNCAENDRAEYGCAATNDLGKITSKSQLSVEPNPSGKKA